MSTTLEDTSSDPSVIPQDETGGSSVAQVVDLVAPTGGGDTAEKSNSVTEEEGKNIDESDSHSTPTSASKLKEKEKKDDWEDVLGSGQIKRKIVTKGTPNTRPYRGSICFIKLKGTIRETGDIVDDHERLAIQQGDSELIQGLDLVLALMDKGETDLVQVAPRFGYGSKGCVESGVPPSVNIDYEITLLDVEREKELEEMGIAERKEIGNKKRERGNWWFAREEYSYATQCYRRALEYLDDVTGGVQIKNDDEADDIGTEASAELKNLLSDRLRVYNNLSAAQLKLKSYDSALQSCENVLRCEPDNVKALFRKGKVLSLQGKTSDAIGVLRRAQELQPASQLVNGELSQAMRRHKLEQSQERQLYQKMFASPGNDHRRGPKGAGNDQKKFRAPWKMILGGFAVAALGIVSYKYRFF